MIALSVVKDRLVAAWAWVKVHWLWILPPLAALLWLLERAMAPKTPVVESGEIVGHDQEVAAADAVAAQQRAAADAAAIAETRRIAAQHGADVQKLQQGVEQAATTALEDTDKTNAFLQDVGKDMRK